MISKKYLNDYRVEQTVDIKGRRRSEVIYIGGDHAVEPQVPTSDKRLVFCLSVLMWPAFLGALLPVTQAMPVAFIMLPFVCLMLPMYFMTGAAFSLFRENDIMKREKAEKIVKRLPPCAFLSLLLSGVSFLGTVVKALVSWKSFIPGDYVFTALAAAICAASAAAFIKCRNIKVVRKISEN